jgi:hypothetical protein
VESEFSALLRKPLHMGRSIRFNSAQLNRLAGVFRCGAVLLLIEVLAWVVALAAVG